jgi:hypothetical protein
MSKLIRHTQKRGTALFVALSLTALTVLSLVSFVGSPRQSAKAPAETQVSAPVAGGADAGISSDQDQTQTAQTQTAPMSRDALRRSAHFAKKLYEPLASQVYNLATTRAAAAQNARNAQGTESPNDEPTLTTDREDYAPYTYVYFTGTGFQPGETVNMIVVETDPDPQSFQPWDVVADANGNFQTSWYVFSSDFIGATFQATATGESSQLSASATFTDAAIAVVGAASLANGTGATLSFTPSGLAPGNLVIANFQVKGGTAALYPSPAPSTGWNVIASQNFENGSQNHRTISWWKIAGSETSYTFNTNTATASAGAIVAFSGVDNTKPFDTPPCTSTRVTANAKPSGVSCPVGTPFLLGT